MCTVCVHNIYDRVQAKASGCQVLLHKARWPGQEVLHKALPFCAVQFVALGADVFDQFKVNGVQDPIVDVSYIPGRLGE